MIKNGQIKYVYLFKIQTKISAQNFLFQPDVQIVVQPGSLAARNYLRWQK